jgi:dephospho-CoA kinase
MKYVIGVTGNIGSGKSTVLRMLGRLGAKTIDADDLAHQAMIQGTPAWQATVDTFGHGILDDNGEIDRQKLGSVVFEDSEALRRLEEIVHPPVDERFREIVSGSSQRVIAVEAIKLIESGIHRELDSLWLVTCPVEERIRRLVDARGEDPDDIRERMAAQMSEEQQALWADVVIDNSGSREETWEQVRDEWEKIQKRLCRNA